MDDAFLLSACYAKYPFNSYFVYLVINILGVFCNKMFHILLCTYPRVILNHAIEYVLPMKLDVSNRRLSLRKAFVAVDQIISGSLILVKWCSS